MSGEGGKEARVVRGERARASCRVAASGKMLHRVAAQTSITGKGAGSWADVGSYPREYSLC